MNLKEQHLNRICDFVDKSEIVFIFLTGSHLYQTNHQDSDFDFAVVTKSLTKQEHLKDISINFYSENDFNDLLDQEEISILEWFFAPENFIFKTKNLPDHKIDLIQLRKSVSAKSNHSYSKAHKKLTVEKDLDIYVGQKSLFHSIRMLDFALQIVNHGRIQNFTNSNHYWYQIKTISDWSELKEKFKPVLNQLNSELRKKVPFT